MELTDRQNAIFRVIVEQFTYHAEPVGSKAVVPLLETPVSSATVRNEMMVLEKMGLLEKTHTSSGRVPSPCGYRYYVEHLMEMDLDPAIVTSLKTIFSDRHVSLEEAVSTGCSILSEMTHLTSMVLGPDSGVQTLVHVDLVPVNPREAVALFITSSGHTEHRVFHFDQNVSLQDLQNCVKLLNENLNGVPVEQVADKMQELKPLMAARLSRYEVLFDAFVSAFMRFATKKSLVYGRDNMLIQPEFSDLNKLRQLMKILENSAMFKAWCQQPDNVAIPVGDRNELIQIGDCSVLRTKFKTGEKKESSLMVIGPNRMPYAKVIPLMDYISSVIEGVFADQGEGGNVSDSTESS